MLGDVRINLGNVGPELVMVHIDFPGILLYN